MLKTFAIYLAVVTVLGALLTVGSGYHFTGSIGELKAGAVILGFGLLLVTFAGFEKRAWNNGICRQNGQSWQLFDCDSQGGRGYKAGDQTIWISYPVDSRA